MIEPELGAGIDPGMAFNPFPSSIWIRRDSNPQSLDCESSSLTTRPDLRPIESLSLCLFPFTCFFGSDGGAYSFTHSRTVCFTDLDKLNLIMAVRF